MNRKSVMPKKHRLQAQILQNQTILLFMTAYVFKESLRRNKANTSHGSPKGKYLRKTERAITNSVQILKDLITEGE